MDFILGEFRSVECQCCNRHFGYELRADGGKTKICGAPCAETFLRRSRSMPRLQSGMNLHFLNPPSSPHPASLVVPYAAPINWNMTAFPASCQQTPQKTAFCMTSREFVPKFMEPIPPKPPSRPRSPSPLVFTPSVDSLSARDKVQLRKSRFRDAKKPRATDVVDSGKDVKLALKEQIKQAMMEASGNVSVFQAEVETVVKPEGDLAPAPFGASAELSMTATISPKAFAATDLTATGISKDSEAAAGKVDVEDGRLSPVYLVKPKSGRELDVDSSSPFEKKTEPNVALENTTGLDTHSATKSSVTSQIPEKTNEVEVKQTAPKKCEKNSFYDKFETTTYSRKTVRSLLTGDSMKKEGGFMTGTSDDWVPAAPIDNFVKASSAAEPVKMKLDEPIKKDQEVLFDNDEWDEKGPQSQKEEAQLPKSMSLLKILTEATGEADDEWDEEVSGAAALPNHKPLYHQPPMTKVAAQPAKRVPPKEKWFIQDLELSSAFRQNTGVLISWIWENSDFTLNAEADSNKIQKLVDEISEYSKKASPMERDPAIGEIVLAPYFGDFYRAVVKSLDSFTAVVEVEFVDYGDTVEVELAECFEVPDDIMKKHPVYGLRFSQVFDKIRKKTDISMEIIGYIKDKHYKILMDPDSSNIDELHWHGDLQLVSDDHKVVMTISDLLEDPSKLDSLRGKHEDKQTSKTLAQLAPKSSKTGPPPKTKISPSATRLHPLMPKAPTSSTPQLVKPKLVVQSQLEPVPSRKSLTETWVEEAKSYSSSGEAKPLECSIKTESVSTSKIPNPTVEGIEGKTLDSMDLSSSFKQGCVVQISFVWNPARLTVNAVADGEALSYLEEEVKAWVPKAPRLKRLPRKNEIVLAPYDGVYYRAVVTGDVSLKLGEAELKFIDYGDLKKVTVKDLRPMSDEIAVHPVYGLELDIHGIGNVTADIWNHPQLRKAVRNEYENMEVRRLEEINRYRWRAELWFDEYDDWTFVVGTAISTLDS